MEEGRYIYCIIGSNQPQSFGGLGIGGRSDQVYAICLNGIAAVVSSSPMTRFTASRENMLAHEKAIEQVMKDHTVLPVRFGTVAENDGKIKRILEKESERFKGLLAELEGKEELALKAIFKEGFIYKDILEKYENIRALKEMLQELPSPKSYHQRMEVGRLVENALQKEKEKYGKDILDALSPLAVQVKINKSYWDQMILDVAFLVEKSKETAFDRAVDEIDAKYGDRMRFKYVGTLPPFNFVSLVIAVAEY